MSWGLVVKPKLNDLEGICIDAIDHAMLVRYATGPEARKGMLERFGLANAPRKARAGFHE